MPKTIRIPIWCVEHDRKVVFYAGGESQAKQLAELATLLFKPMVDAKVFTYHGYGFRPVELPAPYNIWLTNATFESQLLTIKGVGPKTVLPITRA